MRDRASVSQTADKNFPSQGTLIDLSGQRVDASDWVWQISSPGMQISLDWSDLKIECSTILAATVAYVADLIRHRSFDTVRNTFTNLKLLRRSASFANADRHRSIIPFEFFIEIRDTLSHDTNYRLHYLRQWYRYCCDLGAASFCEEVAFLLEQKVVGGNKKGQAVLSLDPEEGPLNDLEITALLNGLRAARETGSLDTGELAALWLCVALGGNPLQFALLREEDVTVLEEDGQRFVQIRVPRIKKRSESHRSEFRQRKLTAEIGQVVLDLMDESRRAREQASWSDPLHAFALFPRADARSDGDPEYARHLYAREFAALVRRAVQRLNVISPRTGRILAATPRRLRYTYATRLVREGVSKRELADLLDHTDLQNVQVYFDIKSDIVVSLDAAMAMSLGPIAQAFLGKVVRGEHEATRGEDPSSRIRVADKANARTEAVGTCGQYSFCGLLAPVACYTCVHFQPWVDGPHHVLLGELLDLRGKRAEAGQDGRMIAMYDATILAIGDVISRIEGARAQEAS